MVKASFHPYELELHDKALYGIPLAGSMGKIWEKIIPAAINDLTVHIFGELGTEKEETAKAIHELGRLRGNSTYQNSQDTDLYNKLSGSRYSTTSTKEGMSPLFKSRNGTLFLDNIDGMDSRSQIYIEESLRNEKFRLEGEPIQYSLTSRLVTGSNTNLARCNIRDDLRARLGYVEIGIPALRNRGDEFDTTVKLACVNSKEHGYFKVDDKALKLLKQYDWPGNVIELQNAVETAIVTHEGSSDILTFADFKFMIRKMVGRIPSEDRDGQEQQKLFLQLVLAAHENIETAAKALGLDVKELRRKIQH